MTTLIELRKAMRNCQQTPTQNVLEHGFSVARYFMDIRNHVLKGTPLKYEWRLPEWIFDEHLWEMCFPLKTVLRYQIYHDCGKPYCRTEDEQGQHFPDHAEWSYKVWTELGQCNREALLMKKDMDLHLMKPSDLDENGFGDKFEAATLLITALCEVHSNAAMFGGTDSTSFKIKWKKLNKLGKKISVNVKGLYDAVEKIYLSYGAEE